MDDILTAIEQMHTLSDAPYSSFPDLELYMDQVLLCLSRQQPTERDDEKITSAMVNNYIKAGLLPRANGKKYNREHLAYLTIISKLKQILSVNDCGRLIKEMTKDKPTEESYELYLASLNMAYQSLTSAISEDKDKCELTDTALKLALISYVNKAACEYIIDIINGQSEKPASAKGSKQ